MHLLRPEDFELVFRNQGVYPNRPINEFVSYYRQKNTAKYANVGISNLLGEEWMKQRQLYAPVLLKLGALDIYLPQLNSIVNDLVKYINLIALKEDDHFVVKDLQSTTYRLALESICMLCLDTRMGLLNDGNRLNEYLDSDSNDDKHDGFKLIKATRNLFEAYQQLYYSPPLWRLIETKAFKKYTNAEDAIYQIADKYVERALIKLKNESTIDTQETSYSLLKTLLSLEKVDERDVRTLILDFISGGINTVSNSLSFILLHLANNPNVQDKLFEEIKTVIGPNDDQITGQHLNKMIYLKAAIKESFRLNSTIPCLVRLLPEDIVLNGYRIPKNVSLIQYLLFNQRSKTVSNVSNFRPQYFHIFMPLVDRKSILRIQLIIFRKDGWAERNRKSIRFVCCLSVSVRKCAQVEDFQRCNCIWQLLS